MSVIRVSIFLARLNTNVLSCTKILCSYMNSSPQLRRWSVQPARPSSFRRELAVDRGRRRWQWWC